MQNPSIIVSYGFRALELKRKTHKMVEDHNQNSILLVDRSLSVKNLLNCQNKIWFEILIHKFHQHHSTLENNWGRYFGQSNQNRIFIKFQNKMTRIQNPCYFASQPPNNPTAKTNWTWIESPQICPGLGNSESDVDKVWISSSWIITIDDLYLKSNSSTWNLLDKIWGITFAIPWEKEARVFTRPKEIDSN